MYFTGIREKGSYKQTIISAISGLKTNLSEKIYSVTGSQISISTYSDVANVDGGLYLSGPDILGKSLFTLYQDFEAKSFFSVEIVKYFQIFKELINAEELLLKETGSYHPLLLNSIMYYSENNTFTFLPKKLIDFLNKYQDVDLQSILYFCLDNKADNLISDKNIFLKSLAWLVYLHFLKMPKDTDNPVRRKPVFYLSDLINDVPCSFSDVLWDILHGKEDSPQRIINLFDETLDGRYPKQKLKVPVFKKIFRNTTLIIFYNALKTLLWRRKKLIILLVVLIGISAYIFRDYITGNRKIDHTAGLNAYQVVELYSKAVNDLELEVLDDLFYKRAGREIRNELSSLYVILKMSQIYGQGPADNETLNNENSASQKYGSYYLKDIEITRIQNDINPVFHLKYTKVLNTGDKNTVYSFKETIYLKEYRDHWYITEINRISD
jgi:hypothetical protein